MKVDDNYFKYTLPAHYYPHELGAHYMNFNTKVHGEVQLKNGMFECSKKGFYRFGFYVYGSKLENERIYFYFHKNQKACKSSRV